MRFDIRAAFLMALAAGLLFGGPAWAQTDSRGLYDRLDRLERDLTILQGQVYRGQGGSGGGSAAPAAPSVTGGGINGDAYSRLDDRINALDEQIRTLTGQIEKANFTAQQVQSKLDRAQADNEVRFRELEQKLAGGAAPAAANGAAVAAPPAAAPGAPTPLTPPAGKPADWSPTMGSPSGSLIHPGGGQPAVAAVAPPAAAPPAAAAAAGPVVLPGKTPQDQYDYAFGLLRAQDMDNAEKAFGGFVAQHPQDPLAGNAMYWQAQIPYSQGKYEQAWPIFLKAYRDYPKSAKAGESLLRLGMSFSNLGRKKEACAALVRFNTEYPDAGDPLRRQATAEKQKLGC